MGFRNPIISLRADQITPGPLPAGVTLPDGSVVPATIALGAVTALAIAAGAVQAEHIKADALDGKTITGALIRTAASGQRVQLTTAGLVAYDSDNTAKTTIAASTGRLTATGATITGAVTATSGTFATAESGARVAIDSSEVRIYNTTTDVALRLTPTSIQMWNTAGALSIQPDLILMPTSATFLAAGNLTLECEGDGYIAAPPVVRLTFATGTSARPVLASSAGRLGTLAAGATLPVDSIPFVQGGATSVRLYKGSDYTTGRQFRVTSTDGIGFYDGDTQLLYVTAAGAVVAPDIYSRSVSTRAVYVTSSGTLGTTSSLRAHKTDVVPLEPAVVTSLLALAPVTFRRIHGDPQAPREAGLIAEDVEAAGMPDEFLYRGAAGELEGVAYERLPVALIAAVQHLHARIAHLEGIAA